MRSLTSNKINFMKRIAQALVFLLIPASLTFTGCKKSDLSPGSDYISELNTQSNDQSRFSEEMDLIDNEATGLAEDNNIAFDGIVQGVDSASGCGFTLMRDTLAGFRRIIIQYNGQVCNGRVRTGTVVLSMLLGQRWRDSGAVLRINIQNLNILRLRDSASITVNGQKSIKNVTGGRMMQLSTLGMIKHEVTSTGMSITFDDGTTRSWQVAKRRTFTLNNGLVISSTGIYNNGTINNISEWGINRLGNNFLTATINPLVVRESCGFRIVSGKIYHERGSSHANISFGLDSLGNPVTSCPMGAFFMKIEFTGPGGNTNTVIRAY